MFIAPWSIAIEADGKLVVPDPGGWGGKIVRVDPEYPNLGVQMLVLGDGSFRGMEPS